MSTFWARVDKTGECWEWTLGLTVFGYAKLKINNRTVLGHRISWEEANGPIPDGLCVCHKCDIPKCVRPDHLFLGTHEDNMADMVSKKRQARGLKQGSAKLSDDQARELIRMYKTGGYRQVDLAELFGISQSQTSHIIIGRKRKLLHVA